MMFMLKNKRDGGGWTPGVMNGAAILNYTELL